MALRPCSYDETIFPNISKTQEQLKLTETTINEKNYVLVKNKLRFCEYLKY